MRKRPGGRLHGRLCTAGRLRRREACFAKPRIALPRGRVGMLKFPLRTICHR